MHAERAFNCQTAVLNNRVKKVINTRKTNEIQVDCACEYGLIRTTIRTAITGLIQWVLSLFYTAPYSLCMQFNVPSHLSRHQKPTKNAYSPTAVAVFLPLFSLNKDLYAQLTMGLCRN